MKIFVIGLVLGALSVSALAEQRLVIEKTTGIVVGVDGNADKRPDLTPVDARRFDTMLVPDGTITDEAEKYRIVDGAPARRPQSEIEERFPEEKKKTSRANLNAQIDKLAGNDELKAILRALLNEVIR